MSVYSCLVISLVTLSTVFGSCGKGDSPSPAGPPTNLTLSFVVSTDNSGNVNFTATANNVVSYEYDLGNGVFRTVANGLLTYRYPASGTYAVNVIAKSANGQTASTRASVTVTVGRSLVWSDEFDSPGAPSSEHLGLGSIVASRLTRLPRRPTLAPATSVWIF